MPRCLLLVTALLAASSQAQDDLLSHTQPDTSNVVSSVVVASCFSYNKSLGKAIDRIVSQDPDMFLWLGDNIYADTEDMEVMRERYDLKKRDVDYSRFLEAKIPVMATWDDHDLGVNNGGKEYPKRRESQHEFLRHFDIPKEDPRHQGQEGVYSSKVFAAGTERSLHIIMLDSRYDRSPTHAQYSNCEDSTTMLNDSQWNWLEDELKRETELKLIASGIQILPPTNLLRPRETFCSYNSDSELFEKALRNMGESELSGSVYESWAEIPQERERLLRMIQKSINNGYTKNIILLSGDMHTGEIHQKTLSQDPVAGDKVTLFEVTGSGLSDNWKYSYTNPNPNRLPVWADEQGNGIFDKPCVFPFEYLGIKYLSCVYDSYDYEPWCYTQVDLDGLGVLSSWGYCAPSGASIPTGTVGTVADDVAQLTTSDRHVIDSAESNYGMIGIDWDERLIKLSVQNEYEEVVSTIIPFEQEKLSLDCEDKSCQQGSVQKYSQVMQCVRNFIDAISAFF